MTSKVAIITGSSRGIGKEIALQLAKDGFSVAVNYKSNKEEADAVVSSIIKSGGLAIAVCADVSIASNVIELFDATEKKFGKVSVLVNNAGVILYKTIADSTEEDFDKLFSINTKSVFLMCKEASKRMLDNGKIINLSSSTTKMMLPTYGIYSGTKAAIEQITKSLAKELGSRGITANVVSPGPTETDLFLIGKSQEQISVFSKMSALGRLGKSNDISKVVSFLASDDANWITGQNIFVNGGTVSGF